MAMDVGGAKGGVKSDINVTPLVDVMLVLLIIVILIAPMLQNRVQVAMPEARNTSDKPDTADQTVVHVDSHSQLFVNGTPQADAGRTRSARLQTIMETAKDHTVYLKGDREAPVRRHHEHDGCPAEGRDRDRRAHHREARRQSAEREGGQLMSHAHMHHGAEKVFKASAPQASSDMNVTPLIDVLLVLLVIFIAALPLTQKGMDINLPLETNTSAPAADVLGQIVADYAADHRLTINKQDCRHRRRPQSKFRETVRGPQGQDAVPDRRGVGALRRDRRRSSTRPWRRRAEGRHRHRRHAPGSRGGRRRRQEEVTCARAGVAAGRTPAVQHEGRG